MVLFFSHWCPCLVPELVCDHRTYISPRGGTSTYRVMDRLRRLPARNVEITVSQLGCIRTSIARTSRTNPLNSTDRLVFINSAWFRSILGRGLTIGMYFRSALSKGSSIAKYFRNALGRRLIIGTCFQSTLGTQR